MEETHPLFELDADDIGFPGSDPEGKLEILTGSDGSLTAATFIIHQEDHTLGNALRYMIMKNPEVDFCGYSAPHPAEHKIHLRIQTTDKTTAVDALRQGLKDLIELCSHVYNEFETKLAQCDKA
jgi:DNA-directed RNA polymerase I and III subunit RPAC2